MVERGTGPKSLMERSKGRQELDCCLTVSCVSKRSIPLVGCPALPFIDQGGVGVTDGRKRKKPNVEKVLRGCRVFLPPKPALLTWQTTPGIACFTDPDRAEL